MIARLLFLFCFSISDLGLAASFSCKTIHKVEKLIPLWNLKFYETLGTGQSSDVIRVRYHNQDLAFVKDRTLDSVPPSLVPSMSAKEREVLTYLSPEEIEEVLKNAYGSKQYDMQRIGLENPNPALSWKENERPYRLKDIVIALSELRANYELLQSLAKVTFQGHPIAPKTYGLIYDPISKLPVGYLVEIVKGRDLLYSVKNKLINRRQMNSIQRQVLDQIQVLQALGVSHGDIVPSNIMVEIQPNGEPVARLIDYNVPLARLISNPAVVAPLFQISLRHLERDFPLSE